MVRDLPRLYALLDAQNRLVAIAPMLLTERPGVGPLRTRQLQFFGADPNVTELRGLICAPADERRASAALMQHLAQERGRRWHWLQWSGLRGDVAALALPPDLQATTLSEVPDYWLPLPADWDRFRSSLGRNVKESLRKCYNSLKRDGHVFELRRVTRPEDCPAAIARFHALHRARAVASNGVRHPDVFATPQSRTFLADYVVAMAARGQLELFELAIGGAVVASRIGFRFDRTLYLYYSGYDQAWGRYSIMTTLLVEAIRWAISERLTVVNLSTGCDVSKTRWHPAEVRFRQILVRRQGWRARAAHAAYEALRRDAAGAGLMARLVTALRR